MPFLHLPSPSSYSSVGPLLSHRIKHQYLALYDFIPVDPLKFTSLHIPILYSAILNYFW